MGKNRLCCSVVEYNVLDTKGEGVGGGIPLPRWRLFGNVGTKYRFLCIIKFKLTSTLAPKTKVYDLVGGTRSVVVLVVVGGSIPLPRWRLFGNLGTKYSFLLHY